MKPVRIDFAPRTARRAMLRTHPATWMLLAAAVALCAGVLLALFDLTGQRGLSDKKLQQLQTTLAQRMAAIPAPKKTVIENEQASAVNSAILQLNLPWRDLLNAIEAATPASIGLLVIEPDAKKRLVKGLAEAKSSDEMIAYIEQLKQQPFFSAVLLSKHEINDQDPNKPLRFHFEAHWSQGEK